MFRKPINYSTYTKKALQGHVAHNSRPKMLTETEDYMIYHNGEAASITIVTELLKHNMKIQISKWTV